MSEIVAKRYAVALFEVAEERGAVDAIETQLRLVVQTLGENEDLRKVLYHPQIAADDKKKLVAAIFEKQVGQEVLNLLKLLVDRKRESLIGELLEAYIKLADAKRGILDVTVTTAAPLNSEEQDDLSGKIGLAIKKKLRIHVNVKKELIGGILLRVGDKLYDATIAGKLAGFRQEIKAGK